MIELFIDSNIHGGVYTRHDYVYRPINDLINCKNGMFDNYDSCLYDFDSKMISLGRRSELIMAVINSFNIEVISSDEVYDRYGVDGVSIYLADAYRYDYESCCVFFLEDEIIIDFAGSSIYESYSYDDIRASDLINIINRFLLRAI